MNRLLLSILLALSTGANAAPFVPRKSSHGSSLALQSHRALEIRGGGTLGPIDASSVAKAASVLAGAQGIMMQFAPEDTGVEYGLDAEAMQKPINKLINSIAGTSILTWSSIVAYLAFADDPSATVACMMSLHVWIYELLRLILGKFMEGAGADNSNGQKLCIVINLAVLYAMTQDYAPTALKIFSVWLAINGVNSIVNPGGSATQWGLPELDDVGKALNQCYGHGILAQGLVFGAVSFLDYDALQAVGVGSFSWLFYHIWGMFGGRDDKLGMPRNPMLFWMAYHAFVIYMTLLS